jgi:hypothetical protein
MERTTTADLITNPFTLISVPAAIYGSARFVPGETPLFVQTKSPLFQGLSVSDTVKDFSELMYFSSTMYSPPQPFSYSVDPALIIPDFWISSRDFAIEEECVWDANL